MLVLCVAAVQTLSKKLQVDVDHLTEANSRLIADKHLMTALKAVTNSLARKPDNMIVLANMRGLVQQQVRGMATPARSRVHLCFTEFQRRGAAPRVPSGVVLLLSLHRPRCRSRFASAPCHVFLCRVWGIGDPCSR